MQLRAEYNGCCSRLLVREARHREVPCAGGAASEAARCLQSCEAVAVALKTDLRRGLLWCTSYASEAAGPAAAAELSRQLQRFLRVGRPAFPKKQWFQRDPLGR